MKTAFRKSKKIIYLVIDGMTETENVNSTLCLSKTPVINGLINTESIMGFYEPVIRPGDMEPKTDVVVPCFFGLPAEVNPGRTVLELIDNNVQIKPLMYCAELKVRFQSQAGEDNWVKLKQVPRDLINKVSSEVEFHLSSNRNFIVSKATESGARILFFFDRVDLLDNAIYITVGVCKKHGLIAIENWRDQVNNEIQKFKNKNTDALFVGWAKGALRGALKFCGFDVNDFSRKQGDFYNWASYYRNFVDWGIPILRSNPRYDKYVLYTKESAFAARKGDNLKKQEAIEFMDNMLGKLLSLFPSQSFTIVVLSDHSADMRGTKNPIKNTCFCILRGSSKTIKKDVSVNFSESLIATRDSKIYAQNDVINMIK